MRDRARIHLPDMWVSVPLFAAIVAVSPIILDFADSAQGAPMLQLMLRALPVVLFLGIVVSLGVSAVRSD